MRSGQGTGQPNTACETSDASTGSWRASRNRLGCQRLTVVLPDNAPRQPPAKQKSSGAKEKKRYGHDRAHCILATSRTVQ